MRHTDDQVEAAAFQIHCELGTTITAARVAARLALTAALARPAEGTATREVLAQATGTAEHHNILCGTIGPASPAEGDEVERLREAIAAIQRATVAGKVCDDVAWFDGITTLFDFCEQILNPPPGSTSRPAQAEEGCVPVGQWKIVVDEPVLIYVVHTNAQYEPNEAKRLREWEGWHRGMWIKHNKGRWMWHGMSGVVTHVAPLPEPPRDAEVIRIKFAGEGSR